MDTLRWFFAGLVIGLYVMMGMIWGIIHLTGMTCT